MSFSRPFAATYTQALLVAVLLGVVGLASAQRQWTWISGSDDDRGPRVYGTQGVPDPANTPGRRNRSVTWRDGPGNLWLFGGEGYAGSGNDPLPLNDLWKYDVVTGNWTWVKGSSLAEQAGTYGTQGVAAAANTPGARHSAVSWTDKSGNLWLFGGYDHATSGTAFLNDLWMFDILTGNWTWVKGSNLANQGGTYGTLSVGAAVNTPGSRDTAVSWTDSSGNLWLFGGWGYGTAINPGPLSDMWKYDVVSGNWTWMKGSNANFESAIYGTRGVAAEANTPGARLQAVSWTDAVGNLWLFGGDGSAYNDLFNDLWKYDIQSGNWTWMKGSNAVNQLGTYGTQGIAAEANAPGARVGSVTWTDASGNLWLFGGEYSSPSEARVQNDLWKYDVSTGNWTWIKGSSGLNQVGVYGIQGVVAAENLPGARYDAMSWVDASGHLYLFGGRGYGSSGIDFLNDLWKYDLASGNWTWVKGSNRFGPYGIYGTRGVGNATNTPCARSQAVSWTDAWGKLWMYGGMGFATSTVSGRLDDLWRYDPVSCQWTWMNGSNLINQPGTYGTAGIPSAANSPGARITAVSWADRSGGLWLFGGYGWASPTYLTRFNDLWKYDVATGYWTWIKGSNSTDQLGTYGTRGVSAPTNTPGARNGAVSWTDTAGDLWMFGGSGYAASGSNGLLNDLWKYNVGAGQWTWMKGSNATDQIGTYGVQGIAAVDNTPGARTGAVSWTDKSGNLWLFGGNINRSTGDALNDLWKYDVPAGNWIWMKGSSLPYNYGTYGERDVASTANTPGGRSYAVSWTDSSGDLWLFGGHGYAFGGRDYLNDLWKYNISSGNWTWTKGANTLNQIGSYGSRGVASVSNTPGARHNAVSWTDHSGNMWLFGGHGYDAHTSAMLGDLWVAHTNEAPRPGAAADSEWLTLP